MKTHRIFTVCGVVACLLAASANGASQYTVTITNGYNLIANELDHVDDLGKPDGNTLNHIMGGDNTLGCCLIKYDNPGAQWLYAEHTTAGWSQDLTLDPGEGAFLVNPNQQAFDLTFTGNLHTPALPVPLPLPAPSGLYSCQDATIALASYSNITGKAPVTGNNVCLWDPVLRTYEIYSYGSVLSWVPSAPRVPRGQSAWFNSSTPKVPLYLFSSFSRELNGGSLTLVWCLGTLQQSSDMVTWTDVLGARNQPVTSPYTSPSGAGCLFFRLRPGI